MLGRVVLGAANKWRIKFFLNRDLGFPESFTGVFVIKFQSGESLVSKARYPKDASSSTGAAPLNAVIQSRESLFTSHRATSAEDRSCS